MKKLLCVLAAILMLATMPVTAYANSSRALTSTLTLSFNDSSATCAVMISGDSMSDVFRAVIKLYYEGERIRLWYDMAETCLAFERSYDISDYGPGTYELMVTFNVNNGESETVSITREYTGG